MDMIERVARAICTEIGEHPDMATPHHPTVKFVWEYYEETARVAIEAMKPTMNRMDVAGCVYLRENIADASGCFETMIDEALKEPTP